MSVRIHRGGRTRAWIGQRLGGDEALGDRVWRRCLHVAGLVVLAVYVVPPGLLGPVPLRAYPVVVLLVLLVLEVLRLRGQIDLPTIRPHERRRVASYLYYAIGLVAAVWLFPEVIAVVVVAGAALVDPLLGELRVRKLARRHASAIGGAVYAGITVVVLLGVFRQPPLDGLLAAAVGGVLATLVEGPDSLLPLDDDLAMIVLPGLALLLLGYALGAGTL